MDMALAWVFAKGIMETSLSNCLVAATGLQEPVSHLQVMNLDKKPWSICTPSQWTCLDDLKL